MAKIKLILLITFITVITLFVGLLQPKMHKQAMITDNNYKFIEDVTETIPVQSSPVTITTTEKNIQIKSQSVKTTPIKTTEVKKQTNTSKVKQVPVKTQSTKITTTQQAKKQVQQVKTSANTAKKEPTEIKVQDKPTTNSSPAVKIETVSQPQKEEQKVLTEQEEIIVWNKWRSDLQNQVMKDTKIAAPMGTGFKFSFTVDKFGNMSNIKVWSTNSTYTDLAVRVIKPVLTSYQRQPILNFPKGTKRVITNVTGGFYISTSTEYSTPSDYSDYEKVRR